jgi:site-specific DNA recombinase
LGLPREWYGAHMTAPTITARELLRVSKDKSGRERSNEEQHTDNARAAVRLRWALGEPYSDIGSASRFARKVRLDFIRLMADLGTDRFGADILIMWESSRGSRKLSEWVALIELCEVRGVRIFVTSDGKLYDPTDARDRRSLQEDATDAEYESAKTSKRTRRAAAATAEAGRPNGPAPYGYRRVFDSSTGASTGQEPDPTEAPVVVDIYRRIMAGEPLTMIAAEFNGRGIQTRPRRRPGASEASTAPWTPQTLRSVALSRTYIAERTHDPDGRVGKPSPGAVHYPAAWPALVERPVWEAVNARLRDPARAVTRPGRGKHWLSFIALCDVCGGVMAVHPGGSAGRTRPTYLCHRNGCVRVPYDALNAYVGFVLLEWLGRDDIAHLLTAEPVDPGAVVAADQAVRDIEREVDELAGRLGGAGPATRRLLDRELPRLDAALIAAKSHRDELTAPALLRGLIEPGEGVRDRWAGLAMPARREVARLVLVPELLGELRVVKGRHTDPIDERATFRRA